MPVCDKCKEEVGEVKEVVAERREKIYTPRKYKRRGGMVEEGFGNDFRRKARKRSQVMFDRGGKGWEIVRLEKQCIPCIAGIVSKEEKRAA